MASNLESLAERQARMDRVLRANRNKLPTKITAVTLWGGVLRGIVEPGAWVVSGERVGFEWHAGEFGENAFFVDEGVRWIRGHAPIGGEKEAALKVAHALSDEPSIRDLYGLRYPSRNETSKRYTP